MDVADIETGSLPGQTARAQSRDPALVTQLRKRIGLVFELGELAPAEELADRRNQGPVIDQFGRGGSFRST